MATTHARKKKATSSVKPFTEPTVFVNCMAVCAKCKALKKYLDAEFKAFCADLGYELHVNSLSSKTTDYWRLYGKPIGVGQATPQLYLVDGDKTAGCVFWPGIEVNGIKGHLVIPETDKWSHELVEAVVNVLNERM